MRDGQSEHIAKVPIPRANRPKRMSDDDLRAFAPHGLVIGRLGPGRGKEGAGAIEDPIRYQVNPGGGNAEWFHVHTEFDADSYMPRRVINRGGYLLIQRVRDDLAEDLIATPLAWGDRWRSWVEWEEGAR